MNFDFYIRHGYHEGCLFQFEAGEVCSSGGGDYVPRGSLYAIMGFMWVSGNPTSSSAGLRVKYEVHDDCELVLLGWGTRKPQVPNSHILTQNLYYKYYYPIPKYPIIRYLDILGNLLPLILRLPFLLAIPLLQLL